MWHTESTHSKRETGQEESPQKGADIARDRKETGENSVANTIYMEAQNSMGSHLGFLTLRSRKAYWET
jgi:hypothetical protein